MRDRGRRMHDPQPPGGREASTGRSQLGGQEGRGGGGGGCGGGGTRRGPWGPRAVGTRGARATDAGAGRLRLRRGAEDGGGRCPRSGGGGRARSLGRGVGWAERGGTVWWGVGGGSPWRGADLGRGAGRADRPSRTGAGVLGFGVSGRACWDGNGGRTRGEAARKRSDRHPGGCPDGRGRSRGGGGGAGGGGGGGWWWVGVGWGRRGMRWHWRTRGGRGRRGAGGGRSRRGERGAVANRRARAGADCARPECWRSRGGVSGKRGEGKERAGGQDV